MSESEITFLATIPPIQSSLKFGGDVGRVTLEIPKSEVAKAVGLIALQDVVLEIRITTYASKKKEAKAKGPHGKFWQAFCAGGGFNSLDLQDALQVRGRVAAEDALRKWFNVSSRTFIAPDDFISWLDSWNLHALATEARRHSVEAGVILEEPR